MPQFAYNALDQAGKQAAGALTAPSRAAALDQLAQRGLFPVRVNEQDANGRAESAAPNGRNQSLFNRRGRVSSASVEAFTRELANLLAGGVPLSRSLGILKREASSPAAQAQWAAVQEDVAGGEALADALAKYPKSFSNVYVAMVRAGETGGFLEVVLAQIAEFRSRERDLLGKVKSAMVYPCVLALLTVAIMIFCMTWFIPNFRKIFDQFGENLPFLTDVVVKISNSFPSYALVAAFVTLLAGLGFQRVLASDVGRRRVEKIMLHIPALGRTMARFALVRFARMLGTLLGAGVPLVSALRVARQAIGIQILTDAVAQAAEQVQRGEALAKSLGAADKLFPASVVEMVAVAEETGRLDAELTRIADTYEKELDRELRMLVAFIEPAMLFIMAAVIGTIIVAMMLPVFTVGDLVQ